MEVIRLDNVSLYRRTQEEFSYDLKKTIFSLLEGKYRKPARNLVLNQLNLAVQSGEKVGIIGANGSGKSTLLKVICNILQPTTGKVWVRGTIAPLIELGAGFDPQISVLDNISLYGIMLGFTEQEMRRRTRSILEFAELEDYTSVPVKALSSGMVARLGFAIATDTQPDILILDEILSVGDERFKNKCKKRLDRFWQANSTILLVSHDLEFLRKSCQRVIWLEHGQLRFDGDTDEAIEFYIESIRLSQADEDDSEELIEGSSESADLALEEVVDIAEEIPEEEIPEEIEEPPVPLPVGEAIIPLPDEPKGVVISRVFIANEHRKVAPIVEFGAAFYIGIEYEVISPVTSLLFGIHVINEQGMVLLEPASHNVIPITGTINSPGRHSIYIKIPTPLLIPGTYYLGGLGAHEYEVCSHHWLVGKILSFDVGLPESSQEWFGQEIVHPTVEWIVE